MLAIGQVRHFAPAKEIVRPFGISDMRGYRELRAQTVDTILTATWQHIFSKKTEKLCMCGRKAR